MATQASHPEETGRVPAESRITAVAWLPFFCARAEKKKRQGPLVQQCSREAAIACSHGREPHGTGDPIEKAAIAATAIAAAAFAAIRLDVIQYPQADACGYMLPRHSPRIPSDPSQDSGFVRLPFPSAAAAFAAIRLDVIQYPQADACGYMLPRHSPRIRREGTANARR